jgi:Flp pilus assembly pilin Flp
LKNEEGQTVVEYMLMLVVMVSIITSIMAKIKKQFIGDPLKCASATGAAKKTLACKINMVLDPGSGGGQKRFQYTSFKK